MRRFASVFASKRDKAEPSPPLLPQSQLTNINKKSIRRAHTLDPVHVPSSSIPTIPSALISDTPSSSDSSSGSASLRTPDDDQLLVTTTRRRKSWIPWLNKKSESKTKLHSDEQEELHVTSPIHARSEEWRTDDSIPVLHDPPLEISVAHPGSIDTDDESEDSIFLPRISSSVPVKITITPQVTTDAINNLHTLISNSLQSPICIPPLYRQSGILAFPRSTARFPIPRRETMLSQTHKKRLLRHLDEVGLSSCGDEAVITFFSKRRTQPNLSQNDWPFDELAVDQRQLESFSASLASWISRPCFEERYAVWVSEDNYAVQRPVSGSTIAVAALEFSEAIETMAGMYSSKDEPQTTVEVSSGSNETQNLRNAPYLAVPSPLRMEHSPTPPPLSALPVPQTTPQETPSAQEHALPIPAPTVIKRGVHFVEEARDGKTLVGYADRLKKRREDKAAFLRDQQVKRALQMERARLEEERLARDKERREWEKERAAWNAEKKAMDEEKRQRLYREEVVASRLRREAQRAGSGFSASIDSLTPSSPASSIRERSHRDVKQRPNYDTRHTAPPSPSAFTRHSGSPDSSRTPSSAGQSQHPNSRPPSMYSTHSSEDVRGKRGSTHSLHARPASERGSFHTNRSNSSLHVVPPVPMFPAFAMDMPLLPPTPPFMMHQYPKLQNPGSPNSHKGSSASPTQQNSSSENLSGHSRQSTGDSMTSRTHRPPSTHRPSSTHSRSSTQQQHLAAPSASSSPHRSNHKRHSSGDAGTGPTPDRGRRPTQSIGPARGRSAVTQQASIPSPWTALPTAQGSIPTSMPMSSTMPAHSRPRQQMSYS